MSGPRISAIVAAAENDVIGRDGGLPWKLSSDLRFFREMTLGKPIIMGRATFQSIGKPLDGRPNIIVTRDPSFQAAGVFVANGIPQALAMAVEIAEGQGADEVMVIGGAEIYAAVMDRLERIYLTRVHAAPEGDATFPPLAPEEWENTSRAPHDPGPGDDHGFTVMVYDRRSAGIAPQ